MSRLESGFTLVELVVAMLVAGIVLAIAVPAFNDFHARGAIRATAADFITAVNTARMQAVSLRTTVTLKPIEGQNWAGGWQIEYPADITSEKNQEFRPQGSSAVVPDAALNQIEFRSSGITSAGEVKFTLCDDRTGEQGREITISPFGKITNETKSCS
ncbi:pilus biogenesis protein [Alcanivorax sp. MD8A]|uniref:GspH/FimT family pseudopilin n=1 Tax=Alcanivorax sp. MD8A TaxID=1177157 RepID=UPI000CBDBE30|nr:GspH/FimT family pseudopilin [Alcanivorax sp. MD8A]PNE02725.1 pilus biogenesis protein [Alcanivorax sp. MD8A]